MRIGPQRQVRLSDGYPLVALRHEDVDDDVELDLVRQLSLPVSVGAMALAIYLLRMEVSSWRALFVKGTYWWILVVVFGLFSVDGYFFPIGATVYLTVRLVSSRKRIDREENPEDHEVR